MVTLSCIHGVIRWRGSGSAAWSCVHARSSSCSLRLFYNLLLVVGMDTCLTLAYFLPTLCCSTTCYALTVLCSTRYSSFWSASDNPSHHLLKLEPKFNPYYPNFLSIIPRSFPLFPFFLRLAISSHLQVTRQTQAALCWTLWQTLCCLKVAIFHLFFTEQRNKTLSSEDWQSHVINFSLLSPLAQAHDGVANFFLLPTQKFIYSLELKS